MGVVRVDIPTENPPHFRESFAPIQQVDKDLVCTEKIGIKEVTLWHQLALGVGVIFGIKVRLINLINPLFQPFHQFIRERVWDGNMSFCVELLKFVIGD